MQLFIHLLISFLILGCTSKTETKKYENKPIYKLKIGETVNIYYSTNSCCYYCFANEQKLMHIEFVEDKMIDKGPEGCDGCNYTAAYIFKAKSAGTDTIKLKSSAASLPCEESEGLAGKYIVIVK